MVKVTMISGAVFYSAYSMIAFGSHVNTSNKGGANHLEVFKDDALTEPVEILLSNVEYFEKHVV